MWFGFIDVGCWLLRFCLLLWLTCFGLICLASGFWCGLWFAVALVLFTFGGGGLCGLLSFTWIYVCFWFGLVFSLFALCFGFRALLVVVV